uniref:Uncharacterized protein n=1 Tax=Eutreptiella gymnastica TaxID=73025 RepID=A0A7S1NCP1_9EUGL
MPRRAKPSGPVHKNSTPYVHMRNCKRNALPEKVYGAMHGGMCKRCRDIMDWKRKYGKWKMMSPDKQEARVCQHCHEKTVFHPFAHLCKNCCRLLKECAKCRQPETEDDPLGRYPLTKSQQQKKANRDKKRLDGMTEREKRTILRQEQKVATERAELGIESSESEWESSEDEEGELVEGIDGQLSLAPSTRTRRTRLTHWTMNHEEQELPKRCRVKRNLPMEGHLELGEIDPDDLPVPKPEPTPKPAPEPDHTDSDEEVL